MKDKVYASWWTPYRMSAPDVAQKLEDMIGTTQEWPKDSGLKIFITGFEPFKEFNDVEGYSYRAKLVYEKV